MDQPTIDPPAQSTAANLEALEPARITELEEQLMARVPIEGTIGNTSLIAALAASGWETAYYWQIRNRLIERGQLVRGRGQGGSVRRAVGGDVAVGVVASVPETSPVPRGMDGTPTERALYEPMAAVMRAKWAGDYRLETFHVEVTAHQGARQTGGKWTRPDITLVACRTFPYVPGRHFDVITFEVKPADALDVTVVYEALSHRRAATRAYALLHVPPGLELQLREVVDAICNEAKRFGVGVIVAGEPGDYSTWEEMVEAVRHEPDPERLNEFLSQQVSQHCRELIAKWFR